MTLECLSKLQIQRFNGALTRLKNMQIRDARNDPRLVDMLLKGLRQNTYNIRHQGDTDCTTDCSALYTSAL